MYTTIHQSFIYSLSANEYIKKIDIILKEDGTMDIHFYSPILTNRGSLLALKGLIRISHLERDLYTVGASIGYYTETGEEVVLGAERLIYISDVLEATLKKRNNVGILQDFIKGSITVGLYALSGSGIITGYPTFTKQKDFAKGLGLLVQSLGVNWKVISIVKMESIEFIVQKSDVPVTVKLIEKGIAFFTGDIPIGVYYYTNYPIPKMESLEDVANVLNNQLAFVIK